MAKENITPTTTLGSTKGPLPDKPLQQNNKEKQPENPADKAAVTAPKAETPLQDKGKEQPPLFRLSVQIKISPLKTRVLFPINPRSVVIRQHPRKTRMANLCSCSRQRKRPPMLLLRKRIDISAA